MPYYMDRHDAPGMTPVELAEAHRRDLDVQEHHGVQFHTYWFDPDTGAVFCLAEGPSEHAVQAVHQEAHGEAPPTIIELDNEAPLNAFFGTIPTYPAGAPYTAPAVRAIVFTDIRGSVAQTQELGDDAHMRLLREHNVIVRSALEEHDGREVKHTGDGIMAAFTSVTAAVTCAMSVQHQFDARNQGADTPLHVSIGISAGEPVTDDNNDLFGATVQLAARLCATASAGEIAVSVAVKELCMGKSIHFADGGRVALKGMGEPTQIYTVSWREADASKRPRP